MTSFPLPLNSLLDDRIHAELDVLYGPGWTLAVNGAVEIVPGPPRWAGMTQEEREREREKIMALWRRRGWMAA